MLALNLYNCHLVSLTMRMQKRLCSLMSVIHRPLLILSSSIIAPFPPFTARRGDNVPQSEAESSCSFTISINAPPNTHFTISSASYQDQLSLGVGQTAQHYMAYFFQNNGENIDLQVPKLVLTKH